jgi:prolyl-tRNA editing enzyme YbaK/EbsC (Cys-tRNA(Pro) deacylase)
MRRYGSECSADHCRTDDLGPPPHKDILPFDLFVDGSVLENERIAFNAGAMTNSIIMNVRDYVRVAQPTVLSFSK